MGVRRLLVLLPHGLPCSYHGHMDEFSKFDLNDPPVLPYDEDEETLAAIDEGIEDVKAGRVVPAEEVRKLMAQWITAYSTRKRH